MLFRLNWWNDQRRKLKTDRSVIYVWDCSILGNLLLRLWTAKAIACQKGFSGQQLGRVDEVPEPQPGGRDKNETDVAGCGFVVSGREPAALFEF